MKNKQCGLVENISWLRFRRIAFPYGAGARVVFLVPRNGSQERSKAMDEINFVKKEFTNAPNVRA